MPKTWDPRSIVRGKLVIALLAMTTVFAGVQVLAPSLASAERVDCSNEEDMQTCEEGSPGGGGGGDQSGSADNGSTTSSGGTGSQVSGANSASSAGTSQDPDPANQNFDDPTKPDPAVQRELEGALPIVRSLDPAYVNRLTRLSLIDPRIVDIPDNPGDLDVLTSDCYRLSSMIGALENKVDSLRSLVGVTYGQPGGKGIQKTWERVKDRRDDRGVEYRALSCGTVLSLDGRD